MSRGLIALACVGLASVPSALADITMMMPRPGVSATAQPLAVVNSFFSEGMTGWAGAPGSTLQYFPDQYSAPSGAEFLAVVPTMTRIPAGSSTTFRCPANGGPCNVVVFYYSCHPCESEKGNIGMVLSGQGFERTRCAPTFTTGVAGGIQHRMVGYVKTIPADSSESIVTQGELDFALFGLSNGDAVTCSDLSTSECEAPGANNFCKYAFGECQLASCVSTGPSFGGGCDVSTCALTELPYTAAP